MVGKTLYCVIVTTKQNNPWIELVTDKKPVAELYQKINIDKGLFSVVVEKELNQYPRRQRG